MKTKLHEQTTYIRELVDGLFEESTPSMKPDWMVPLADGKYFFTLIIPAFEPCGWLLLESWKWYRRAEEYAERGTNRDSSSVNDLCDALIIAATYEARLHHEYDDCKTTWAKQHRTFKANMARRKKARAKAIRRKEKAIIAVMDGKVASFWKAAEMIADDESSDERVIMAQNVWRDIKCLKD